MRQVILASTSPRRRGLLQQIGLKFKVVPSTFKEDMSLKMPHSKLTMLLAYSKARSVMHKFSKALIIGADTFMVLNNERLGKPFTIRKAVQTLTKISGKTLKVYSGLALIDTVTGKHLKDFEVTKIKIRKLTKKEILSYVKTREPLDKAGAIGIQGLGAIFIEKIEGCYSNVVGLPLHALYRNLKKLGLNLIEYI